MFHIEEVLQLKDTEDVKLVVRRHAVTLAPGLLASLLLIVFPFFFLFPLFSWGVPGVAVFIVAVLAGVIAAVRAIALWNADVLIITTLRIVQVDQRGLFSRFVTEVPLASVQDVSWICKGVVNTMLKAGTLSIQTAGTSPNVASRRIGHPERVHELINDLRHATTPRRTDLPPDMRERLRKLSGLLERMSPAALDRVEIFLKNEGREQAMTSFLATEKPADTPHEAAKEEDASTYAVETRTIGDAPDSPPSK